MSSPSCSSTWSEETSAPWPPAWRATGRPVSSPSGPRSCRAGRNGCGGAGARDVYVVVSLDDLPGPPVVVVPLGPGADAAEIGRLLCGDGEAPHRSRSRIARPSATRSWPGLRLALERVRKLKPARRPDLAAAFAAVSDEAMGVRIVLAPSPDTRRVFEELVPTLPRELGGGPITEWTRGVHWVAAGLVGARPSFAVVIAAPSAAAARALRRRGPAFAAFLEKSPFGATSPGWSPSSMSMWPPIASG